MSTSTSTIEQILSQVGDTIEVEAKKMFGEFGLFVDGKMVALVCDDTLYVKSTAAGLSLLGKYEEAPPYPGAKPLPIVSERFARAPGKLAELFKATWKELPLPKPKSPKKKLV